MKPKIKRRIKKLVQKRTVKLETEKEKAKQESLTKSEFLANMSHEIRTPMHAILSYAELSKNVEQKLLKNLLETDKKDLEKVLKKLLRYSLQIEESGDSLRTLLDRILDLSKLQSGTMDFDFQERNFSILVNLVVKEFEALSQKKGLQIVNKIPEKVFIYIDQGKIVQVLRNLIGNAIKFTKDGLITVSFAETKIDNRSAISLKIADQGPGIPENELSKIFDRFTQSSGTMKFEGGTGLGLQICKAIVKEHNGFIVAANNEAIGANFTIVLPKNREE